MRTICALKIFFYFFSFIILTSCDKDPVKDKDIFTLTSKDRKGFKIESLKIIDYSKTPKKMPDFFVFAITTNAGDIVSPGLSNPFLENIFVLIDNFENYETAFQYFSSFELKDDYIFEKIAAPVLPNQIWLIKAGTNKFGIFLITKTQYYEDNDKSPYAEVSFKAKKI